MINYRVDDLNAVVAQLRGAGVPTGEVTTERDAEGFGKFARLSDPEGNPIELWQHLGQGQVTP